MKCTTCGGMYYCSTTGVDDKFCECPAGPTGPGGKLVLMEELYNRRGFTGLGRDADGATVRTAEYNEVAKPEECEQ